MKLMLKASVPHLGEPGDLVQVKKGYARNYLLPKGFAVPATESHLRAIEHELAKFKAQAAEQQAVAQALAKKLSAVVLTMERKVSDPAGGHLYGSVSVADIGDALDGLGFEIDKGEIHLEHPIKLLGDYDVRLTLAYGVDAAIKVSVLPEGGEEAAPPPEVAAPADVVEDAAAAGDDGK